QLRIAAFFRGTEPVLVETMPGRLSNVNPAAGPGSPGIRAIEIVDGSPRGLTQTRRDRGAILGLASPRGLPLGSGTDNHRRGRTAPGWTLVRSQAWRFMSPDSLAFIIEQLIRQGRRAGTQVVERTVGTGQGVPAVVFTPIVAGWGMLTTISWP